jgi:hypothetical protein
MGYTGLAGRTMTPELKISFSHNYPKLHGQIFASLVAVELRDRKDMTDKFIKYDTQYGTDEFYTLPSGKSLVLLFWGSESIPFTTVRLWTPKKAIYYQENIGKLFLINIKDKP